MSADEARVRAIVHVWRNPWVRTATYLTVVAVVVATAWTFRDRYAFALQVGVIGFVIAYVLDPLVQLLGRIRVRRPFAVVLVYLALFNVFVFGSILFAQVVAELGRLVQAIPEAVTTFSEQFARLGAWTTGIVDRLPTFVTDFLDQRLDLGTQDGEDLGLQAQDRVAGVLESAVSSVIALLERLLAEGPSLLLSGATNLVSTTLQAFLVLLASAYFLYDYPRFTANARRFVPTRWRTVADDVAAKADRAVGGYLRGQLLITTLLGLMIWVSLSLIGIPLATAISFLAAVFNLVPYLGPIIGVVPAVLLGFTVGPWAALGAVIVFIVANQIEGNVLSPLILSRSVDLHPVTVLLSIMTGLGVAGFLGAILAVPVVALGKLLLEEYVWTLPTFREGDTAPSMDDEGTGDGDRAADRGDAPSEA